MKKIQLLMALLLLPATYTAVSGQSIAKTSSASFGRHGGDCSSGRGVCSFDVNSITAVTSTIKSAKKVTESTFVLRVKKTGISAQEESKIAGKTFSEIGSTERPTFEQTDTFIIDENSLQNMGIQPEYNKILPGNYPISILSDTVEITFTLSK